MPYNLRPRDIKKTILDTYEFLFRINRFLIDNEYPRLERLLLGNSFSGVVSEVIVRLLSDNSENLTRNNKIGGHPDLILKDTYTDDETLTAPEGIEVKTSKQKGGWQGHNPEAGYLMVYRYIIDEDSSKSDEEMKPLQFVQVLCSRLEELDWKFSGRKGASRRTITASIQASGMHKLRSNAVYQDPDYIIPKYKKNIYSFKQHRL